jgi:hypothetical protein
LDNECVGSNVLVEQRIHFGVGHRFVVGTPLNLLRHLLQLIGR